MRTSSHCSLPQARREEENNGQSDLSWPTLYWTVQRRMLSVELRWLSVAAAEWNFEDNTGFIRWHHYPLWPVWRSTACRWHWPPGSGLTWPFPLSPSYCQGPHQDTRPHPQHWIHLQKLKISTKCSRAYRFFNLLHNQDSPEQSWPEWELAVSILASSLIANGHLHSKDLQIYMVPL